MEESQRDVARAIAVFLAAIVLSGFATEVVRLHFKVEDLTRRLDSEANRPVQIFQYDPPEGLDRDAAIRYRLNQLDDRQRKLEGERDWQFLRSAPEEKGEREN